MLPRRALQSPRLGRLQLPDPQVYLLLKADTRQSHLAGSRRSWLLHPLSCLYWVIISWCLSLNCGRFLAAPAAPSAWAQLAFSRKMWQNTWKHPRPALKSGHYHLASFISVCEGGIGCNLQRSDLQYKWIQFLCSFRMHTLELLSLQNSGWKGRTILLCKGYSIFYFVVMTQQLRWHESGLTFYSHGTAVK